MPNAPQACAGQETHLPDALMAYAQEGQHAFAETGLQESPPHDPGDLFARSMSHFWAGHMDLAM